MKAKVKKTLANNLSRVYDFNHYFSDPVRTAHTFVLKGPTNRKKFLDKLNFLSDINEVEIIGCKWLPIKNGYRIIIGTISEEDTLKNWKFNMNNFINKLNNDIYWETIKYIKET
jgi:hypothetical protein